MNEFKNNFFLKNILSISIFIITIYSVLNKALPNSILNYFDNLMIWWPISFFLIVTIIYSIKYYYDIKNNYNMRFVILFMFWEVISIIHGCFVAVDYWDWFGLIGNALGILLPLIVFSSTNKYTLQSILIFYIKYTLPLFVFFSLLIRFEAYGIFLSPIIILLLMFRFLPLRWKIISLFIAILVITSDYGARSNILKFTIPLVLIILYYYKNYISFKLLKIVNKILIFIPFIFFALGILNIFNIFEIQNYTKGDYNVSAYDENNKNSTYDIREDTRTFLYVEVINSSIKNNYWLYGRSAARGNDTDAFSDLKYISGREERLSNEAAILNIFTWSGAIGVILYFLVFYKASELAIYNSNNIFLKITGIYLSFRWIFAWIEDANNFSITTYVLWLLIGICYSKTLRKMTDQEINYWIKGIFNRNYRTNLKQNHLK